MSSGERMGYFTIVPSVPPGNAAANALVHAGDYVSLKNYERCSVVLKIGTAITTRTLRIRQATNVAGAGVKALNFAAIWRTGARLYFDPDTLAGAYQVGEAVVGAGGGSGTIHSIHADHLVIHTHNGIAYVASEVITGAVSGATADLIGASFYVDEDILCREELAAPANTFVAPAVSNKVYVGEFKGADLDVTNGYDCVLADIFAVGAADDTARSVDYILSQPRYANEPMETAIYD